MYMEKAYFPQVIMKWENDPYKMPAHKWLTDSPCESLEKALHMISSWREVFTVYCAWVDEYDNNTGEEKKVFFECYVDVDGHVKEA